MIRYTWKMGFLVGLLLLAFSAKGQDTLAVNTAIRELMTAYVPVVELPIYELYEVDAPPGYPGGEKELLKFVVENFKYPGLSKDQTPPSKARVNFVVETDGSLMEVKDLDPSLISAQMEEFVKLMPRWKPAKKDGQPVRVRMILNISCIKWE